MSEVIDAFTHVMPYGFFEALIDAHPNEQLRTLEEATHLWDVGRRVEDMDAHGVDKQVLTLVRPPIWRGLDAAEARALVETANDEVAAFAAEYPDRFVPIATVPYPVDGYVDELDRCVEDLGMAGVQLFSNVGGRPIDDEAFFPFYERIAQHDVPIWIHPQLHDWYPWIGEFDENKVLGWPFDTSVALLRLVMGGVFEAFPSLRVVAHHLGGMIPFFEGRIETVYRARRQYPEAYPIDWPDLSRPILAYFEQVYGDTVVGGSNAAMACGHAFFGDNRVVFGSDYPLGPDEGRTFLRQALGVVDELDASESVRDRIRGDNLASLLDA